MHLLVAAYQPPALQQLTHYSTQYATVAAFIQIACQVLKLILKETRDVLKYVRFLPKIDHAILLS